MDLLGGDSNDFAKFAFAKLSFLRLTKQFHPITVFARESARIDEAIHRKRQFYKYHRVAKRFQKFYRIQRLYFIFIDCHEAFSLSQ